MHTVTKNSSLFYLTEDPLKVKNSYSRGGGGRTRDGPGQVQFR
jgi:hypothetical protein